MPAFLLTKVQAAQCGGTPGAATHVAVWEKSASWICAAFNNAIVQGGPTFTFAARPTAFCMQGGFLQLAAWELEASPGRTLELISITRVVKAHVVTHVVTHARIYNM